MGHKILADMNWKHEKLNIYLYAICLETINVFVFVWVSSDEWCIVFNVVGIVDI